MSNHIIGLVNKEDRFDLQAEHKLVVPFNIAGHPKSLGNSFDEVLSDYGVQPVPIIRDFLNLAICAYSADVRIKRSNSYDDWTRDLHLHLPVSNPKAWDTVKSEVMALLQFLTGDYWEISFRKLASDYVKQEPKKKIKKIVPKAISLFSGGLDSFVGALDLLEEHENIVLVSHHSKGGGPTSSAQERVIQLIRKKYPEDKSTLLQFWIDTPKGEDRASEITTRGRSILFIALGLAVSSAFKLDNLYVSENGLISLNVPLTNARLGSYSTRTTHPYYVYLLSEILRKLSEDISIHLPYRFLTKGEMLAKCAEKTLLKEGIPITMSCAHPSAGRWQGVKGNPHCGYCVPCIIRRAAIKAYGRDSTRYVSAPSKGDDFRVFKIALESFRKKRPKLQDVLISGPIPCEEADLPKYLSAYSKGMKEVMDFIDHC